MKLILAIVNNDDGPMVTAQLNKKGIYTTKIASTGGFLSAGNMTLISGVEDEKVDEVISVFNEFSRKRTQMVSPSPSFMTEGFISRAVEVTVGGATIFVLDVDKFIKL